MSNIDDRLQAIERSRYPALVFNGMYNEEKLKAYEERFGINPHVKTFDQMYDGSEKKGFKPSLVNK